MQQTAKQMSESILVGVLLILSGGYLDAYSYLCRGEVFANAQTGNIVLLGISLAQGNWRTAIQYLLPILVFAFGVYIAERFKWNWKERKVIHWRQVILLVEIFFLFLTAFLGPAFNWLANSMISFVCALQVESFRKIRGNACATTMCTGNLRSAAELMCRYHKTGDLVLKTKSIIYYLLIFVFVLGAMIGTIFAKWLSYQAVLVAILPLIVCFFIMFKEEDHMEFMFQFMKHDQNRQ